MSENLEPTVKEKGFKISFAEKWFASIPFLGEA